LPQADVLVVGKGEGGVGEVASAHGAGEWVRYLVGMASAELIEQAGAALADAAGAGSKVILFGSHARGEGGQDSDVDFLVIEPRVEDRGKEWLRLRRALGKLRTPVDIIVMEEAVAERRAKVPGTMVYHAMRDGRVIAQR
jgi:uncharacterized protein